MSDLPELLQPGDVLVVNDTRVIPAQLRARRGDARIGITPDRPRADGACAGPGPQRAPIACRRHAELRRRRANWKRRCWRVRRTAASRCGSTAPAPTSPPHCIVLAHWPCRRYIDRQAGPRATDAADYQTMFATHDGAVAAPTAGLHFTPALRAALEQAGVALVTVTLHVGVGTFLPVHGPMRCRTTTCIRNAARSPRPRPVRSTRGGAAWLQIGTTSLRLLESAADANGVDPDLCGRHRPVHPRPATGFGLSTG